MGEAIRYTAGEGFSTPGKPQSGESAPAKPAEAPYRTGNQPIRIQAIPDDVQPDKPVEMEATGPSTGMSSSGVPTPMSRLKPNDSIVHPELGRMEVRVLAHMGLLVKDGDGYKFPSDFSDPSTKGTPPASPTQEAGEETDAGKGEASEGDGAPLADADKLMFSRGLEMVISQAMQEAGESAVVAIAEALTSNRPDALANMLPEYESAMRLEQGEGAETVAALVKEVKDMGRGLAAQVGLEAGEYEAAESWILANHPKEAAEANRAMWEKGDPRPAQKLLAKFAASPGRYSEADLDTAPLGDGMSLVIENGKRYIVRDGDRMLRSEAIRLGVIKVSRG